LHNNAHNKEEEAHLNMRDFRPNFIRHSFTLSHVHSLGRPVSHSFISSFTHLVSLIHSFTHSLNPNHSASCHPLGPIGKPLMSRGALSFAFIMLLNINNFLTEILFKSKLKIIREFGCSLGIVGTCLVSRI
jgi:hypothetical protein